MPEVIKIGEKQKHLRVPDGWKRVKSGSVRPNDKFANVGNPNKPEWEEVWEEDFGADVEDFECIIRAIKPR